MPVMGFFSVKSLYQRLHPRATLTYSYCNTFHEMTGFYLWKVCRCTYIGSCLCSLSKFSKIVIQLALFEVYHLVFEFSSFDWVSMRRSLELNLTDAVAHSRWYKLSHRSPLIAVAVSWLVNGNTSFFFHCSGLF